jgi:hypothetical protein
MPNTFLVIISQFLAPTNISELILNNCEQEMFIIRTLFSSKIKVVSVKMKVKQIYPHRRP